MRVRRRDQTPRGALLQKKVDAILAGADFQGVQIVDRGFKINQLTLDAITRTQIRHDLEMLWLETRKTVLFITHSIEEAIGLSDRVLVMSPGPGRIVEEIAIDLPRPRPAHLGAYPSFNVYAERINTAFRGMGVIRY